MLRSPRGLAGAAFLKLAFAARTMAGEPTVLLPELRSLLASGRARLIDVRSLEEAAAGTIPGALNIPGLIGGGSWQRNWPFKFEGITGDKEVAGQLLYTLDLPKAECLSLPAPPHKLGKWLPFKGSVADFLCRFVRPQDQSFQAQPQSLRLPNCRLSILPSGLLLPVSELETALQMEPAAFKALYSTEKPKLEDENLIFFCQRGKRGFQATQLARGLGYKWVRNYEGAYSEWFQKES